jgi:alcohol dehydrogenase class IV
VNDRRQRDVSAALGAPGLSAADAVARLVEDLALPASLSDVGVDRSQFDAIALGAMQNMFVRQNPKRIDSASEICAILEAAF